MTSAFPAVIDIEPERQRKPYGSSRKAYRELTRKRDLSHSRHRFGQSTIEVFVDVYNSPDHHGMLGHK
jgi:hypothetical protein